MKIQNASVKWQSNFNMRHTNNQRDGTGTKKKALNARTVNKTYIYLIGDNIKFDLANLFQMFEKFLNGLDEVKRMAI